MNLLSNAFLIQKKGGGVVNVSLLTGSFFHF